MNIELTKKIDRFLQVLVNQLPDVDPETSFHGWRELYGFRIGWLNDGPLFHSLMEACDLGFTFDDREIVFLRNREQGDCHLHEAGEGRFLVLGQRFGNGFENPKGGICVANPGPPTEPLELQERRLRAGGQLSIRAKKVHVFYGVVDTLGLIYPRIAQGDEAYDTIPHRYLDQAKRWVVQG